MPTVVLTVDCAAAHENKHCYATDLVEVAEEFTVPLTWMIYVSGKDPMANITLYHKEYMHRIPSWHEIGLKVHFEDDNGYVEDPVKRRDMMLMAKNVMKSTFVKPTAFRAGSFALVPSDLPFLEDMGFLVDSSVVPDANQHQFVDWKGAPAAPYHPAPDNLHIAGGAKLLELPIATFGGEIGYLNGDFNKLRPILDHHTSNSEVIVLGMHDYYDCANTLKETLTYLKSKGSKFSTLTMVAADRMK